jgi:hypothetical protein
MLLSQDFSSEQLSVSDLVGDSFGPIQQWGKCSELGRIHYIK